MDSSLSSNTPISWITVLNYEKGPVTWRSYAACPRAHEGHGRTASFVMFPLEQALALNTLQEEVLDLDTYEPASQF